MTVAELIAALEKCPQDATVIRYWTDNEGRDLLCSASEVRFDTACRWENERERLCDGPAVIVS